MRIKVLQSFALFWTHSAQNPNLFFGEPLPLVEDSKNIWVAQFHYSYVLVEEVKYNILEGPAR